MRHTNLHLRAVTVIVSLLFAIISGCTSDDDQTGDIPTIRFWHFWSEPGQKTVLKELVASFEKKHNCRVEMTELSWNDGKAKLQAAFNSGAPPDVVELGSDWVAQFSSASVLTALGSFDTTSVLQYALAPGRYQGALYAAPWTVDTRVLYVNQQLFRSSGRDTIATLDELQDVVEMIQAKGQPGWGGNSADAHRLYKKILPFIWTCGGDVLDQNGKCVLYSPQNVQALSRYADLSRTGIIETQRQLDATFIQGRLGIWNSGSWLIKKIKASTGLSVRAMLFPGIAGRPGVSFAGGEYLAVSSASKQRTLAEQLLQHLLAPTTVTEFCSRVPEAGFPAVVSAYNDPALRSDPLKSVFAEQLRSARMTPVHPRWLDIESVLENAVVRVLLGEATPDRALQEAHDEIVEITGA